MESIIDPTKTNHMTVEFMAKSGVSYQVWKETEPELFNLFERNFDAVNIQLCLTGDVHCTMVKLELPGRLKL
jgi:hypothetical protein